MPGTYWYFFQVSPRAFSAHFFDENATQFKDCANHRSRALLFSIRREFFGSFANLTVQSRGTTQPIKLPALVRQIHTSALSAEPGEFGECRNGLVDQTQFLAQFGDHVICEKTATGLTGFVLPIGVQGPFGFPAVNHRCLSSPAL